MSEIDYLLAKAERTTEPSRGNKALMRGGLGAMGAGLVGEVAAVRGHNKQVIRNIRDAQWVPDDSGHPLGLKFEAPQAGVRRVKRFKRAIRGTRGLYVAGAGAALTGAVRTGRSRDKTR